MTIKIFLDFAIPFFTKLKQWLNISKLYTQNPKPHTQDAKRHTSLAKANTNSKLFQLF